jgi:hypothetical protein
MRYGKWRDIMCVYDESSIAFGGGRYCKFSLKEGKSDELMII